MKIKIKELEGQELDWAVTVTPNPEMINVDPMSCPEYSQDPALWGKIMDENKIDVAHYPEQPVRQEWVAERPGYVQTGPTPGVAICRCYVAMNTEGDSVEVPEGMNKQPIQDEEINNELD